MEKPHLEKGLYPFWSEELIDTECSDLRPGVNRPERRERVMVFDRPWEGDGTNFFTIVKDDGFYRLYYEAWAFWWYKSPYENGINHKDGINVCYAESRDGIHWERPDLGLCEFHGSKHNNIIMLRIPDNFTVMKDKNPDCPPERRYKAVMYSTDITGCISTFPETDGPSLICLTSADGIRFERYCVISRGFSYDSQNTLHWNSRDGKYYCFFRGFHAKNNQDPDLDEEDVRDIMVSESEDLLHWSDPVRLDFGDREDVPLYTNCISAYPYDNRYYIGFPTRYVQRNKWTANYDRLCGADRRRIRCEKSPRLGLALTDCVFMSSRDNCRWSRFDEACLTPGPETVSNWVYGDCYPAVGAPLETPSPFSGEPSELSIYVGNHHAMPESAELIRCAFRRDGFASVKAAYTPGILRTRPFSFEGDRLKLNFRTSARGGIVLSVLDEGGDPVEGYTTCELFGDSTDRTVDFDKSLHELIGKTVCFEFRMRDAELYAFRLQ